MENPLISVIVPIYKVEDYLNKCVDSIINQTYQNLEIILVDDGSPDNCGKICDEYAEKDARIKVIHKENGGVSSARNVGFDMANGEYIGFVDPDDWIDSDMYELLCSLAIKNNADVSMCSYYLNYADGREVFIEDNSKSELFYSNEIPLKKLFIDEEHRMASLCNKLYSAKAIAKTRLDEKYVNGEDWKFNYEVFKEAKVFAFCYSSKYHYFMRDTSAVHLLNTRAMKNSVDLFEYFLNNETDKFHAEIYKGYLMTLTNLVNSNIRNNKNIDEFKDVVYYFKLHKLDFLSVADTIYSRIKIRLICNCFTLYRVYIIVFA